MPRTMNKAVFTSVEDLLRSYRPVYVPETIEKADLTSVAVL